MSKEQNREEGSATLEGFCKILESYIYVEEFVGFVDRFGESPAVLILWAMISSFLKESADGATYFRTYSKEKWK